MEVCRFIMKRYVLDNLNFTGALGQAIMIYEYEAMMVTKHLIHCWDTEAEND